MHYKVAPRLYLLLAISPLARDTLKSFQVRQARSSEHGEAQTESLIPDNIYTLCSGVPFIFPFLSSSSFFLILQWFFGCEGARLLQPPREMGSGTSILAVHSSQHNWQSLLVGRQSCPCCLISNCSAGSRFLHSEGVESCDLRIIAWMITLKLHWFVLELNVMTVVCAMDMEVYRC